MNIAHPVGRHPPVRQPATGCEGSTAINATSSTRPTRTSGPTRGGIVRAVAAAVVALLGLVVALTGAGTAHAAGRLPTVVVTVGSDGTEQGTPDGCPITGPGGDNDAHDGVVCTNDSVTWLWTYDVPFSATSTTVTLEQILPDGGRWDPSNRTVCAGDGTQFTGTGTVSNNFRTLTCTITFPAGRSLAGTIPVVGRVDGRLPDGTALAPTLTATGTTNPTSTPPAVTVRSHPRLNIVQTMRVLGPTNQGPGGLVVNVQYRAFQTDTGNGKGMTGLQEPVTWTDDLAGMTPGTQPFFGAGKAFVSSSPADCRTVNDPAGYYTAAPPGILACAQAAPGQPVTLSLTGADTTHLFNGQHPGGQVTAFSGGFNLLVPFADLPSGPLGRDVTGRFTSFDPDSVSGASNYGAGFEPGGPAQPCPPAAVNDNCATVHLTGPGNGAGPAFSKQIVSTQGCTGAFASQCPPLPHDDGVSEAGYLTPGDRFTAVLNAPPPAVPAVGSGTRVQLVLCDTWDPAQARVDTTRVPALTRDLALGAAAPASYTVQYTDRVFADDAARKSHGCGDPTDLATDGPWFDSVAAAGGAAAVTGVRFLAGDQTYDDDIVATVPMVNVERTVGTHPVDWFAASWGVPGSPSVFEGRYGYTVTGERLGLLRNTDPAGGFTVLAGQQSTLVIVPSLTIGDVTAAEADIVTITETVDHCLVSPTVTDPGVLAFWTVTMTTPDPGPDGLACTRDDGAPATITFTTRAPVLPGQSLTPIRYTGTIAALAPDGTQVMLMAVMTAVRAAPGSPSVGDSLTAGTALRVRAPAQVAVSKAYDDPVVEVGDTVGWTVSWANSSTTDAGRVQWVDVLPYDGDANGTLARGSLSLLSATPLGAVVSDVTVEVTGRAATSVSSDPSDPSNLAGGATVWCAMAAVGTVGCPATLADVTALRVTVGDLSQGRAGGLHLTARTVGEAGGDTWVNVVGPGAATHLVRQVPVSNPAAVRAVASSIGRTVWWDTDADGTQDPGEPGIPGVHLSLLAADGTVLATTTTDADGRYAFPGLHSGTYAVVVDQSDLPTGTVPTYDLDGGTVNPDGRSGPVRLAVATDRVDVDFGFRAPAPTLGTVASLRTSPSGSEVSDAVTVANVRGGGALAWSLLGPVAPVRGGCAGLDWAAAPVVASGTLTVAGDDVVQLAWVALAKGGCYSYAETVSTQDGRAVSAAGLPDETVSVVVTGSTNHTSAPPVSGPTGRLAHTGFDVFASVGCAGLLLLAGLLLRLVPWRRRHG